MAKTKDCSIIKKHYIIAFFVSLGISIGLLTTSFFLPPTGRIEPSVLQATGELFFWPSLAFAAKAVEEGKNARIQRGKTTVEVGDLGKKHQHNNYESDLEDGDNAAQEISEG